MKSQKMPQNTGCAHCESLQERFADSEEQVFELCVACGRIWVDVSSHKPWKFEPSSLPADLASAEQTARRYFRRKVG